MAPGSDGNTEPYHLMSNNRELVELQQALVSPVDHLVAEQPSSSDHVRGHAIT
jgi:hypothetical protein